MIGQILFLLINLIAAPFQYVGRIWRELNS